jgi:hypothetical protein
LSLKYLGRDKRLRSLNVKGENVLTVTRDKSTQTYTITSDGVCDGKVDIKLGREPNSEITELLEKLILLNENKGATNE